jgi:F0F1-type ATP synthase assembly protein I
VVAGLVMSLPWLVFGPAAFGYYLDYLFGTSPWIALIGLVIGVTGSVIDVVVILRRVGLME